jgi:hypothetical protein
MAIIGHTSNLNLTQFHGSSIKPAIFETHMLVEVVKPMYI